MSELMSANPVVFLFLTTLLGLLIGSLLNVIIYRLPLMLQAEFKSECQLLLNLPTESIPFNLFYPRSFCPACKNLIKWYANIPVISYLVLTGRCFSCKNPISYRYPLIEILSAALCFYATWLTSFNPALIYQLLFIWIVIALFFIDLDHQLLPDCLTLSLLWIGLLANIDGTFTPISDAIYGAVIAYLSLWLVIKCYYLLTGKIGMGNGDFKLFAAFGAWFGWKALPMILLYSSISGAIIGLLYLKTSNNSTETPIPFGPFLVVSGIIYLLWGSSIMSWYLGYI